MPLVNSTIRQTYHRQSTSIIPPPASSLPSISADGDEMEIIPVPTKEILILLISILCFAITDLTLSLLKNLGVSSGFLGVVASAGTISHVSMLFGIMLWHRRNRNTHYSHRSHHSPTHTPHQPRRRSHPQPSNTLSQPEPPSEQISRRERPGRRPDTHPTPPPHITWDTHLPPTSKVLCIVINIVLSILFLASAALSLGAQLTGFFGPGGRDDNDDSGETSVLRGPVGIVYAAAVTDVVCAIDIFALILVGNSERRRFVEKMEGSVSLDQ